MRINKDKKDKQFDRFKCGIGCGIEYANKTYPMAKVHELDCPTRAFIASGWRPPSKSWLQANGFFFRHDGVVEDDQVQCTCPAPCDFVHVVE